MNMAKGHLSVGVVIVALSMSVFSQRADADSGDVVFRRAYAEGGFGQVHLYTAAPGSGSTEKTPLVMFHQSPKSALELKPLILEMGMDRMVIGVDTPGYGGSDRPAEPPTMMDIAEAIGLALDDLGYGPNGRGEVDLFGFHTGSTIAGELAVQRPDMVRRIVLSGIGYVSMEERERRLARVDRNKVIAEDGTDFLSKWHVVVTRRRPGMSYERAIEIFMQDIRALPKDWYGYNAVFSYPIEERFPLITQPILLLQANEITLEWTRDARRDLLPHADLIEMLELKESLFEVGYSQFAKHLRNWLDNPVRRRPDGEKQDG